MVDEKGDGRKTIKVKPNTKAVLESFRFDAEERMDSVLQRLIKAGSATLRKQKEQMQKSGRG